MGLISIIFVLLSIATGCFAIGVVSGSKLGSCYKGTVVLKTTLVFIVANLLALSLSFITGKLLYATLAPVMNWLAFSFLFLIGVRLLLESIEKSPSLNYTDIVQSSYLIKVAVQASIDSFMFGFVLALVSANMLLAALFFSALFTFFAVTFGLAHGHAFTKTVLGSRLQLISGVVMIIIAVKFLLSANS